MYTLYICWLRFLFCFFGRYFFVFFFFFSSRRRHTRWPRDWSSDVCSSDLVMVLQRAGRLERRPGATARAWRFAAQSLLRSEERRVGKEGRFGWGADG